jgi:hypothetical protein
MHMFCTFLRMACEACLTLTTRFTITFLISLNWSHSAAGIPLPLLPYFPSSNPRSANTPAQLHLSTSSGNEHQGEAGALGAIEPTNCTSKRRPAPSGRTEAPEAETEVTPRRISKAELKPRVVTDHPERPAAKKSGGRIEALRPVCPEPTGQTGHTTTSKYNNFIQTLQTAKHETNYFFSLREGREGVGRGE